MATTRKQTVLKGDTVSIVVADSGLGGLSVCAELANNLERRRDFENVAIVYFDALPEQGRGYNQLPTTAEKVRVFDRALAGMERLGPDAILIACNTLSVLYSQTPFSRTTRTRVVDIIDFGVQQVSEHLVSQPDSQAIIFGTPTTIEANTHASRLVERGIAAGRIVCQPCDGLAREIERDPESAAVSGMIDSCVGQAVSRLEDRRKPVCAALCCTHYGYSQALFSRALARHARGAVSILNPNGDMAACIAGESGREPKAQTRIEVTVVAKVALGDDEIGSMSRALARVSPLTANALRHYRHDAALF
jgi:glutamate racemase